MVWWDSNCSCLVDMRCVCVWDSDSSCLVDMGRVCVCRTATFHAWWTWGFVCVCVRETVIVHDWWT
jgi:hypothetical protein